MDVVTRDPEALLAESLFAVIGLSPLLDQAAPPVRITRSDLREAEALPARLMRAVNRFVSVADLDADRGAPDFDARRAIGLVTALPDATTLAGRIEGLPPTLGVSFMDAAGRGLQLLRDNAPALTIPTLTGLVQVKPGLVATSRFRRAWQTVEDPRSVFDDLLSGVLSREQVAALEAVYPGIYALAREQVIVSLSREKTKVKGFLLSPRKDRILQTFMRASAIDARLAAEIQKLYDGPDLDEKGDVVEAPQQPGIAPDVPQAEPSRAQRLEGR